MPTACGSSTTSQPSVIASKFSALHSHSTLLALPEYLRVKTASSFCTWHHLISKKTTPRRSIEEGSQDPEVQRDDFELGDLDVHVRFRPLIAMIGFETLIKHALQVQASQFRMSDDHPRGTNLSACYMDKDRCMVASMWRV